MLHPLQAYRKAHDLTQGELATRLGVSRAMIARWETGERRIPAEWLGAIAQGTDIPPTKLRPDLAPILREP